MCAGYGWKSPWEEYFGRPFEELKYLKFKK
jgi:hypothetical protein